MEKKTDRTEYLKSYAKEHYKRIPLDVPIKEYELIKIHADKNGEPINTFIRSAIAMRIQSEEE